jgi:hypothetical protein
MSDTETSSLTHVWEVKLASGEPSVTSKVILCRFCHKEPTVFTATVCPARLQVEVNEAVKKAEREISEPLVRLEPYKRAYRHRIMEKFGLAARERPERRLIFDDDV